MVKKPEQGDYVKHIRQDATGIVNANYEEDGVAYLDVEISQSNIYYRSPAENWTVVSHEE